MRNADTLKRSTESLPRLYEKYIGHDNNRDFFMLNMSESKNMSRQLYIEWMPQILYNHHQTGPPGTVVAGPPYRDPFNYVYDPLLMTGIDAMGAAMSNRLNAEGKPGYTMKSGSVYSTWWNGGLRTAAYYHNIIGLLTEIIGSPTPSKIPLVPNRLIPNSGTPYPIEPQQWYFKNSIDYSVSLNYAVLNYASRYKDELLYNIYTMGKNSIDAGNKDTWTKSPKKVELLNDVLKLPTEKAASGDSSQSDPFSKIYKNKELRDARGYIITANQTTTATSFINILINSGIQVQHASSAFSVAGKNYPSGSYIVKTNQAFRPHVLDMFEPQDHPNDFQYPGGPPVRPYDAAGWTPAYTMGLQFDRILDDFNGPFENIAYGDVQSPKGNIINSELNTYGYHFSTKENAAYKAVNDLLKEGASIYKNKESYYVGYENKFTDFTNFKSIISKISNEHGVVFTAATTKPSDTLQKVQPLRIALWDRYGGSMSSGWVRWIFEQYHFPFNLLYVKEIDSMNLNDKYDVIVFVEGAIPALRTGSSSWEDRAPKENDIPEMYKAQLGSITVQKSIPALQQFLNNGGKVVTIGSSANLAYHLNLPVRNALVEMVNGAERNLPGEKFYIPGSVMQVAVNNNYAPNWGMENKADVYFSASPVFKLSPEAIAQKQLIPLAWYPTASTLRSGWAFGQAYLQDGVAAFEANVGKGKLFVYGPEITFRAQTHGTYKMLFNQLYK
jgi:hypothetical protein